MKSRNLKGKVSKLGLGIFGLLLLVAVFFGINYMTPGGIVPPPSAPPQDCEYSPNLICFNRGS